MRQIAFILTLTFLFSGCSMIKSSEESFKFKYFQSTGTTNFQALTHNLLMGISSTILDIKEKKRHISPLYVTDFVNLNNLNNRSQLGFILSDELKTNVTQDINWPIYQVEFSKYLRIGEAGTKLLSRDINDIKYKNMDDNTYALVGTYAITQRQLLIYLKLINLKNGVILKSSTKRLTLTDEIKNLERNKRDMPQQVFQPVVL